MKRLLIGALSISACCVAAFFLLSNQDFEVSRSEQPSVLSMTKSIDVPEELTFAGECINLNQYDYHERYDREINGFTYLHSTTMILIKKANRYFPVIEPILKKNGIPDDFKYLAVIESNLNHRAVSPAGAAGLWQFMKSTAPSYGLQITTEVDERYSVEKSTEAACQYLNEAYRKYNSWSAVALSYNAGQGRISGELDKQQTDEALDLWLVEETTRYYYRMLAIKQVMEHPYKYGFVLDADQLYKPIKFRQVDVTETITDLATFASEQGITYAQLKDFNSWLRDRKLTISAKGAKTYTILIPEKESLYYNNGTKVEVHNKKWITHE